jgi:hypothetical protein
MVRHGSVTEGLHRVHSGKEHRYTTVAVLLWRCSIKYYLQSTAQIALNWRHCAKRIAAYAAVLTHLSLQLGPCCCDTLHSRPNIKNAVPKINSVARVLVDKLAKHTEGGAGSNI